MEQQFEGAQSIARTVAIVRAVAAARAGGARLVDIVDEVGLSKSTVHRILQALVRAGWIEQSRERGRFFLGVELHALGLAAPHHEVAALAERSVMRIAEQVGDTAYCLSRAGLDAVCLARCVGSYPVKVLTIDVGMRRPLGMGAASLAILAGLRDDEIGQVIDRNVDDLTPYVADGERLDGDGIWEIVRDARSRGHSYIENLFIPGMAAIGMAFRAANGAPIGAIGVAAITSRLGAARREEVAGVLAREVRVLETRLGALSPAAPGSGHARVRPSRALDPVSAAPGADR